MIRYNALCGYESEERPLTEFGCMLVVASSPSVPRTSRIYPEPQTAGASISSFVIENLDDALFPRDFCQQSNISAART
jgi:hypothetical protein